MIIVVVNFPTDIFVWEYVLEIDDQILLSIEERVVINEEDLFYKLTQWIIENKKVLDFAIHYNGAGDTIPTNLSFKNYEITNQDDIDNFTWSKKDIDEINKNLSEILDFCKETMPEDLFLYLMENKLIGVSFLNVSS